MSVVLQSLATGDFLIRPCNHSNKNDRRKDWHSGANRAVGWPSWECFSGILPRRLGAEAGLRWLRRELAPQHRRIPNMSATRLTDTQLIVLSAAAQRDDRCAMLPPKLRGGAAQKVVQKLIDLGFIEAVRARGDLPVWRRDADNRPMALRVTSRGLEAIGIDDEEPNQKDTVPQSDAGTKAQEKPSGGHLGRACRGRPNVDATPANCLQHFRVVVNDRDELLRNQHLE
jgi:hypothetical protein